jgi:hypothetical protein
MHTALSRRRPYGFVLVLLGCAAGCGETPVPAEDAAADTFLTFDIPPLDIPAADVRPTPDAALPDGTVAADATVARDAGGDIVDVRFVVDAQAAPDLPPGADVGTVPTDGPAPTCTVTEDVGLHIDALSTAGWATLNRSRGVMMHGCAGVTRPQDCLASAPLASTTTFGANWQPAGLPNARLRVLFTSDYRSSFWTRSSADGRFVGHGARIVDLAGGPRTITTAAQYDPGFFPDNSGFFYHASIGPRVCEQSLLSTGMPTNITLMEPQCARAGSIGLYEHLGASLNGNDYYVVYGRYTSDDGGHSPTLRDVAGGFGAGERQNVAILANTGSGYTVSGTGAITTPFEADPIISPSSQLLMTRLTPGGGAQTAFVLRRLQVTRTGAAVSVEAPVIARYCFSGGKGSISYDERWFTYHHYVTDADARELGFTGPDDPNFAPYRTRGAANSYLIDLRTGARTRITNMGPGQYALFPHFRSDGWIYFVARTAGATPEHIVASDAALVLP